MGEIRVTFWPKGSRTMDEKQGWQPARPPYRASALARDRAGLAAAGVHPAGGRKATSVEWVAVAEKLAALVAAAAAALANAVSAGCWLACLRMHARRRSPQLSLFPAPAESRLPTRIRGRHESLHGAKIAGRVGEGRQQERLTCG